MAKKPNQRRKNTILRAITDTTKELNAFEYSPTVEKSQSYLREVKSMSEFAVRVHPGELHFNSAHFITFNGTCENLHGHNFHVKLEARGDNTGDAFVIDFVLLTRIAAVICRELHDGVLFPGRSDEVEITEHDGLVTAISHGKRFTLSKDSVIILPLPNTTAEMLALHIGNRLVTKLEGRSALGNLRSLEVAVEEADNQWGIHLRTFAADCHINSKGTEKTQLGVTQ